MGVEPTQSALREQCTASYAKVAESTPWELNPAVTNYPFDRVSDGGNMRGYLSFLINSAPSSIHFLIRLIS